MVVELFWILQFWFDRSHQHERATSLVPKPIIIVAFGTEGPVNGFPRFIIPLQYLLCVTLYILSRRHGSIRGNFVKLILYDTS